MYQSRVEAGTIRDDPRQRQTIDKLHTLWDKLIEVHPVHLKNAKRAAPAQTHTTNTTKTTAVGGNLGSLFNMAKTFLSKEKENTLSSTAGVEVTDVPAAMPLVRGYYVWGGVGCGKTMMMDMFYDCVPKEVGKCPG